LSSTVRAYTPKQHCHLRHLPKNFDNVHNLEFRKDPQGNPTKVAIGMYSGEGEYVPFAADCLCDGPVEVSPAGLQATS